MQTCTHVEHNQPAFGVNRTGIVALHAEKVRVAPGHNATPTLGLRPPFVTMTKMPTREQITEALKAVIDPELHRSIVELDMVRSIEAGANGVVDVTVSLTTPGCPIKGHFQTAV